MLTQCCPALQVHAAHASGDRVHIARILAVDAPLHAAAEGSPATQSPAWQHNTAYLAPVLAFNLGLSHHLAPFLAAEAGEELAAASSPSQSHGHSQSAGPHGTPDSSEAGTPHTVPNGLPAGSGDRPQQSGAVQQQLRACGPVVSSEEVAIRRLRRFERGMGPSLLKIPQTGQHSAATWLCAACADVQVTLLLTVAAVVVVWAAALQTPLALNLLLTAWCELA